MSLKEIFCQDKAIDILQKALVADKAAHAYIFTGPEGVGKLKTAKQRAKLLLCKNPTNENNFADSCDSCESCQLFDAGSHPDFNPIYKELIQFTKDGKTKTTPVDMPIDVIREFLIAKVPTKPTLSKKRIFVVTEAEKLNASSQNSLLKILEEPPEYCTIILLCTRLEKLLPTTKSRCQTIRFGPIDENIIIEKLKQTGLAPEKTEYFARLAQGSLGQAEQWAKLELAEANLYETKKQLIDSLAQYQYADALELAQWISNQIKSTAAVWIKLDENTSTTDIKRRTAKIIIQIIISALHDAMTCSVTPQKPIFNSDQLQKIKILANRLDPELAAEKISVCYKSMRWIEANVNEKLIFEQLLLNLAVSDTIKL
ncbi:MAG: DNA polymerase III subunit [Planctomycetes bacterium]|nr:DNA polymerase III subunit [Planctomycetota bacterium]